MNLRKDRLEKIQRFSDMPDEIRVLEPEDFCKGILFNENGQRCLMGWLESEFKGVSEVCGLDLLLLSECKSVAKKPMRYVCDFNDSPKRSMKTLARVWNRFIARLGYTKGNPEAKNL